MRSSKTALPLTRRLRVSPNFVLAFAMNGNPYVAKDTEPYTQYWLTERYRVLHGLFAARTGSTVARAIDEYCRITGTSSESPQRARLLAAISDMYDAGVLIGTEADTSRYDADIVENYLTHRPFPAEIAQAMINAAGIGRIHRVLDLAGGPGDLALQLAAVSDEVTLMELSKGFLAAAAKRARAKGLHLDTLHESCNRLVHSEDTYDVISVAQALHWLDDVAICRGVCRSLNPGGSFFVVHSVMRLADAHPLAFVFGRNSILGEQRQQDFVDEIRPLKRRLDLLFEALDAPQVQRIDPYQRWQAQPSILPSSVRLFRQPREFGLGFARGFLTPQHIEPTGMSPDAFWKRLEADCAQCSAQELQGVQEWALLHYRRGPPDSGSFSLDEVPYELIGTGSAGVTVDEKITGGTAMAGR